ncbi:MAG: hypothetical protein ACYDAQ_18260 [Mycobacteriales bacterium]
MAAAQPRWGWHRLDRTWAHRLVAGAQIGPGDCVLDVWAGFGALTEPLLATSWPVRHSASRHHCSAGYCNPESGWFRRT